MTDMMKHYVEMKEKYKDCILFFRLGDFYEMFFEDAEICSRVLELTLTGKDCGLEKRAPMCGVPHHACETYIAKLLENGYKVAICEQKTLPQKGVKVVERDVVRIITPGTLMDSSMLDESKNTYVVSIYKEKDCIGLSSIDISTGKFFATEFTQDNILSKANDFLVSIKPSEVIVNSEMYDFYNNLPSVISCYLPKCQVYDDNAFEYKFAVEKITGQFGIDSIKKCALNNHHYSIICTGALINYIFETQKRKLTHIDNIEYYSIESYMQIDANTRRNLELTETLKDRKKRGSLFWVLNNF